MANTRNELAYIGAEWKIGEDWRIHSFKHSDGTWMGRESDLVMHRARTTRPKVNTL